MAYRSPNALDQLLVSGLRNVRRLPDGASSD